MCGCGCVCVCVGGGGGGGGVESIPSFTILFTHFAWADQT